MIGRMPSAKPPPVIAPVAPASRSGSSVMPSSPSHGPSIASAPSRISSRSLLAAPAVSILKYDTCSISRAMRASSGALSTVPLTGASWIMIGIDSASDRRWKYSTIAPSGTRIVAPWYGGITITIAAPSACARRERSIVNRELKCVVVTITGTRPATCSMIVRASNSRSSSASTNCSEKLARMQMPCEPASIMKSMQRFWLARSSAPSSVKVVGATGKTPRYGVEEVGAMMKLPALVVHVDTDGPEQHQALDHLLIVDADAEDRHPVVHDAHDHGAHHGPS